MIIFMKKSDICGRVFIGAGIFSLVPIPPLIYLGFKEETQYSNRESVVEYNAVKSNLENFIAKRDEILGSGITFDDNMEYQKKIDLQIVYNVDIERVYALDRLIEREKEKVSELERDPVIMSHNKILERRDNLESNLVKITFTALSIIVGSGVMSVYFQEKGD